MLHTIVPIEDVFTSAAPSLVYEEVAIEGRRLVVTFSPDGPPRLVRLISTDPQDYLDPRLQPGAAVEWAFPVWNRGFPATEGITPSVYGVNPTF